MRKRLILRTTFELEMIDTQGNFIDVVRLLDEKDMVLPIEYTDDASLEVAKDHLYYALTRELNHRREDKIFEANMKCSPNFYMENNDETN